MLSLESKKTLGAGSHRVDASHLSLTRTVRASSLLQAAPEGILTVGLAGEQVLQFLTQLSCGNLRGGDVRLSGAEQGGVRQGKIELSEEIGRASCRERV